MTYIVIAVLTADAVILGLTLIWWFHEPAHDKVRRWFHRHGWSYDD